MNYILQRQHSLLQQVRSQDLDGFLVTTPVNVTYLTGFTGEDSFLFLTPKNTVLVSDSRFEDQIREECPDLDAVVRKHSKTTYEAAAETIKKSGVQKVGVEGNRITLAELERLQELVPSVTFVSVRNAVESLRLIKDPSETEKIRESVRVAERAFRMFVATLRETDTEKEMVDALESYVRRAGGRGTSFPPIVAVGERGALPHAPPTAKQLGEGSKLLVDWGADLLYKSDITRTLRSPFGPPPTRRNKFERVGIPFDWVYESVLAAQKAALDAIRPGVKAKDVDAAARKALAAARHKEHPDLKLVDHFTHGLGHGIGLEVHEGPRIRANSEDVLEVGMVFTIEPGVYIPGWGGARIEDDVLVTPNGATLLTTLPREVDWIV